MGQKEINADSFEMTAKTEDFSKHLNSNFTNLRLLINVYLMLIYDYPKY